jgi:hypothetical protein
MPAYSSGSVWYSIHCDPGTGPAQRMCSDGVEPPIDRHMQGIRIVIRRAPARTRFAIPNVIERLQCLISGHSEMMVCRNNTVALHCARCGRTSPGWQIDHTTPRRA